MAEYSALRQRNTRIEVELDQAIADLAERSGTSWQRALNLVVRAGLAEVGEDASIQRDPLDLRVAELEIGLKRLALKVNNSKLAASVCYGSSQSTPLCTQNRRNSWARWSRDHRRRRLGFGSVLG